MSLFISPFIKFRSVSQNDSLYGSTISSFQQEDQSSNFPSSISISKKVSKDAKLNIQSMNKNKMILLCQIKIS